MSEKVTLVIDLEKGDLDKPFVEVEKKARKTGQQVGKELADGATKSVRTFLKTASLITGAVGAIAGAFTFREAIRAAQTQEDAVNRLNSALQASGTFTKQVSQDFQDYAASLQAVSTVGDEVILESIALTRSLTRLDNEGIKKATQAALDLSAALKIDLQQATQLVARASNGQIEAFRRYGIQVQKGTDDTKTFNNVLQEIEARFGGRAKQEVNTFSGSLSQLRNNFGDLLEVVGGFVTQNPFIIEGLKTASNLFSEATKNLTAFLKSFDVFNEVIIPLVNFNDAVIKFVIAPLELALNSFRFVFDSINLIAAGFVANLGKVGTALSKALNFVGIKNEAAEGLKSFGESSNQVLDELTEEFKAKSIFDFNLTASLAEQNEELRTGLDNFNATLAEKNTESQGLVSQNKGFLNQAAKDTTDAAKKAAAAAQKLLDDANRVLNQGLARAVSGGIQSITIALAEGQNVFAAFGDFILKAFGDLAIQMGEFYIASGLASLALLTVDPTAQIATGAALVALGSILKSFSSGGISRPSGGGAIATDAGQSGFNQTDLADIPRDLQRDQRDPQVSLTIQGSVFDSEETGTTIAKILSDAFGKQGVTLSDPRFA